TGSGRRTARGGTGGHSPTLTPAPPATGATWSALEGGGVAAVDRIHLAGDPLPRVAAEQHHERGRVVRLPEAADGVRADERPVLIGPLGGRASIGIGLHRDRPQRDAVGGDPLTAAFLRDPAHEAHGRGLRRAVDGLAALALAAGVRDDGDDAAPALLEH